MMKHELISQKQFDDTPVLFIDDYIISESPNGWEGEDYERVITANGNKYSIPSFTVDVEEGYEWTFEDDINFIMYNGEKSEYITDSAVLQKLSDFSKKASNYKNCKMKNMGISLVDFGEMKLSVLYKDENENMQSLELFRFGEECAWLDNAEVQEFVKMLIDKGYIDGIYAFMIPQIK